MNEARLWRMFDYRECWNYRECLIIENVGL